MVIISKLAKPSEFALHVGGTVSALLESMHPNNCAVKSSGAHSGPRSPRQARLRTLRLRHPAGHFHARHQWAALCRPGGHGRLSTCHVPLPQRPFLHVSAQGTHALLYCRTAETGKVLCTKASYSAYPGVADNDSACPAPVWVSSTDKRAPAGVAGSCPLSGLRKPRSADLVAAAPARPACELAL